MLEPFDRVFQEGARCLKHLNRCQPQVSPDRRPGRLEQRKSGKTCAQKPHRAERSRRTAAHVAAVISDFVSRWPLVLPNVTINSPSEIRAPNGSQRAIRGGSETWRLSDPRRMINSSRFLNS